MDDLYNRVARRRRPGESGFTLIELLVVVAVLAILAAIVIFNVVGVANKGRTAACKTDEQTIQTAVDSYYNDLGTNGGTSLYPDSHAPGDTANPGVGDAVNYTELLGTKSVGSPAVTVGPWIHTTPPETFQYTGVSGTIVGSPAC